MKQQLFFMMFCSIMLLNSLLFSEDSLAHYRIEYDSIGQKQVPANKYYGIQTERAFDNFKITDIPIAKYRYLIKALAIIKEAAAIVNKKQQTIKPEIADAIIKAAKEVAEGKFDDQFPLDVIQGGAGTSTNMNINEVIANRALEILGHKKGEYEFLHPNNHVNASQSTNDVYPTAGKITIIWYCQDLFPALEKLRNSFFTKGKEFANILKIGRTQLQDAVPMTLGQEFNAFGVTLNDEIANLKNSMTSLYALNMGATAIGTGINTKPGYSEEVIKTLAQLTNLPLVRDQDLIESTSDVGCFVRVTDALKGIALKLTKISSDLRLLSSGPQSGFEDIVLPAVQPGSTIMPGKVNPVIPEAVNQASLQVLGLSEVVDMAAFSGQLQLNPFEPVILYNTIQSTLLLKNVCIILKEKCIDGIMANEDKLNERLYNFAGLITVLAPYIGYDKAAKIVEEAQKSNKSVWEILKQSKLIKSEKLKKLLNPRTMTSPNVPSNKMVE